MFKLNSKTFPEGSKCERTSVLELMVFKNAEIADCNALVQQLNLSQSSKSVEGKFLIFYEPIHQMVQLEYSFNLKTMTLTQWAQRSFNRRAKGMLV